tara:strand:+ start:168 stop:395 length:228 start_codon:yes stop_codon:yes gene_type:complete
MRIILIFFLLLMISNCSLNEDSQYWTENSIETINNKNNLKEILKKSDDPTSMTLEEYKIYIDDYTKKSKYPDISK